MGQLLLAENLRISPNTITKLYHNMQVLPFNGISSFNLEPDVFPENCYEVSHHSLNILFGWLSICFFLEHLRTVFKKCHR